MKEVEKEGRILNSVIIIIIITGKSGGGLGAPAACTVACADHAVYSSMRKTAGRNAHQVKEVEKCANSHDVDLCEIEVDESSQESPDATLSTITTSENSNLDVVIHNEDHVVFGPTEPFILEQLAQLCDSNMLIMQRVNRAALPHFRAQGKE
jgi:NADP-dependent 3-hydroxy acid dehydrogenase YdfG